MFISAEVYIFLFMIAANENLSFHASCCADEERGYLMSP